MKVLLSLTATILFTSFVYGEDPAAGVPIWGRTYRKLWDITPYGPVYGPSFRSFRPPEDLTGNFMARKNFEYLLRSKANGTTTQQERLKDLQHIADVVTRGGYFEQQRQRVLNMSPAQRRQAWRGMSRAQRNDLRYLRYLNKTN